MGSEAIILPAAFGSIVWLVYIVVDGFRRRQRLRVFTEFHSKLLDRIGSAREFAEFFSSQAGERFLESLAAEKGAPQTRERRGKASTKGMTGELEGALDLAEISTDASGHRCAFY